MGGIMKIKIIPSNWLKNSGHRLDCGPYLSGAIEAREQLHKLSFCKESLQNITNGIFHAGRESRLWVKDSNYGIPFMSSTDILSSDLSNLPLISKKQVKSNPNFIIREGWTLVTRSGTIGRLAYTKADMDGLACSEHVMRIVPDETKVKSGYIYAYLSSKFGIPLIISGTYGSIIQSIEPHHVTNLPVPRLGDIENYVHELIQQAAKLRVDATSLFEKAGKKLNEYFGFPEKLAQTHRIFSCSAISSNNILKRFEATYHDVVAQESDRLVLGIPVKNKLGELDISISETGRLKQVFVDDEYGVPFLTSSEIFRLRHEPQRFLAKRLLSDENEWAIREGDLLLARSGQIGGIIGRGVWADRRFIGGCVSVDVIRISAQNSRILPGYLYAYLFLTDVGYRQLIRMAAGSSIPHLSVADVLQLLIPRGQESFEREIDNLIWTAGNYRAEAQMKEDKARALVEHAIEEGCR